jgi:hypothetical protein
MTAPRYIWFAIVSAVVLRCGSPFPLIHSTATCTAGAWPSRRTRRPFGWWHRGNPPIVEALIEPSAACPSRSSRARKSGKEPFFQARRRRLRRCFSCCTWPLFITGAIVRPCSMRAARAALTKRSCRALRSISPKHIIKTVRARSGEASASRAIVGGDMASLVFLLPPNVQAACLSRRSNPCPPCSCRGPKPLHWRSFIAPSRLHGYGHFRDGSGPPSVKFLLHRAKRPCRAAYKRLLRRLPIPAPRGAGATPSTAMQSMMRAPAAIVGA